MNKKDSGETLSLYMKEINSIPLLTRQEEDRIARKAIAGDNEAQTKLIEANLRFVVNTARKYQNQGLPMEDLISEGNIGLMNAVTRFDPDLGYHFISYAVWWIRQAILKAIHEKSRMIRLPMNRVNELVQIENIKKAALTEMGDDVSDTEISRVTGIPEQDIKDLSAISQDMISLETALYDKQDSTTLGDSIEDSYTIAPDEHAIQTSLAQEIDRVFSSLTKKESEILRHRFGLLTGTPLSLKEVGDLYGLTKERIRQIEKKALERLRHPSRARYLKDYIAA